MARAALAQAPGKTLSIGMAAADVSQLDPFRATSTQDKPVVSWIFNGLVRFKPGSTSLETLEPDLAESWTRSDDGRTGPSPCARASSSTAATAS